MLTLAYVPLRLPQMLLCFIMLCMFVDNMIYPMVDHVRVTQVLFESDDIGDIDHGL
jgi:hypothetical protein